MAAMEDCHVSEPDYPLDRDCGEYRFYVEPLDDNIQETMQMWADHWGEQREECVRGIPLNPDVDQFMAMEKAKLFTYVTVRRNADIVGHIGISFGANRQTSRLIGNEDFFYLKPEHRKGMLALKLIKFARNLAFTFGATEFRMSHRFSADARMGRLMERCGFVPLSIDYLSRR